MKSSVTDCIFDKGIAFLKLLFILFAGISVNKTNAQQATDTETLFVTNYSVEQGLRQSMVSQIYQDSLGLIWTVTGDGLHYFDGQQFRAFRVKGNNTGNYSDNVMRSLAEAEPGRIIVSTNSSLLAFSSLNGTFETLFHRDGYCPIVFRSITGKRPLVWVPEAGFSYITGKSLEPVKLIFDAKPGLPADFVPLGSIKSAENELLVFGEQGLLKVNVGNAVSGNTCAAGWIPLKGCRSVVKTTDGKILVLAGSRFFQLQPDGELELYAAMHLTGKPDAYADSKGNLWITERDSKRIFRLVSGKLQEIKLQTRTGKYTEILEPAVLSIFEDKEQNLWFGTDGNGVILYTPAQLQFHKANIGFVRCITAFNNNIWAGTFNNGLWELSADLADARRINQNHFTASTYFLDLRSDKSGRLWVATRNGLEIVDNKGNIVFKHAFKCLTAKFIQQQPNDTILLCCDNIIYRFSGGSKPGFTGNQPFISIRAFVATAGYFWIGTQFGIYRYKKTLGFSINEAFKPVENHISESPVFQLFEYKGKVWAATGNGIECYSTEGEKLKLSENFNQLNDDVIYSVMPDELGRIWFTGNTGIGCVTADGGRLILFNDRNNLQSSEFNHNAAYKSQNADLYFGGINGINHINPALFNPVKKAPVVKLIALTVSDTAFAPCIPPPHPHFTISRKAPHLSGRVFTTDYLNAGSVMFSFFLEGYETEYSKPSTNADFVYRNLPPGKYRLLVKCADPFKNWSEPECLLTFAITPPFYTLWWFIVAMVLVSVAVTVLVVKRIQKVRYLNQIKEIERQFAIERERLRIAKDMHDEVGASLTRISILSELARKQQANPAKAQLIIDQISEISGNVVDEISEIIWAMNPRNDTLDSFTSYIRQYVSAYLESADIERDFRFPAEVPPIPMSSELRRNLFLTLKEALHNIVKHSKASHVELVLEFENEQLTVTISDNGSGFTPELKQGHGNGLINMQKRLEDCKGSFTLQSEPGKGTEIKLIAKLK